MVIKKLLKQTCIWLGAAALGILAIPQASGSAEVKPSQNLWQQPYTPTRLQWLSVNLRAGVRTDCGVYSKDGVPRAFYTWKAPGPKENRLVLLVLTRSSNEADADCNFCASSAFTSLRAEALRMEASPPNVELLHSQLGKDGLMPSLRTYQCSVPAALLEKDVNFGGFRELCK